MQKKDVLILNIKEQQSKRLAQAISSDTCRKIMDALAIKEYTETELAKELSLPPSTVHYNIEQLVASGLVVAEEYHYSAKGKEVQHYKLAGKYIIITPTPSFELADKLKAFLPALFIMLILSFGIQFFAQTPLADVQPMALQASAKVAADDNLAMSAPAGAALTEQAPIAAQIPENNHSAFWFLGGSLASLIIVLLALLVVDHFKRR